MEMYKTDEKMSFADYYSHLQDFPNELRREIVRQLEISEKTFYNKFNENRFSFPEKLTISHIVGQPVEILFPES